MSQSPWCNAIDFLQVLLNHFALLTSQALQYLLHQRRVELCSWSLCIFCSIPKLVGDGIDLWPLGEIFYSNHQYWLTWLLRGKEPLIPSKSNLTFWCIRSWTPVQGLSQYKHHFSTRFLPRARGTGTLILTTAGWEMTGLWRAEGTGPISVSFGCYLCMVTVPQSSVAVATTSLHLPDTCPCHDILTVWQGIGCCASGCNSAWKWKSYPWRQWIKQAVCPSRFLKLLTQVNMEW
jgi:hypothetical protein